MLSLSVPQPVNTTSPGRQPTTAATESRASSIARRAWRAKRCDPDGLAYECGEERHHRLDRLGPHGRRRRVIEVGERVFRHREHGYLWAVVGPVRAALACGRCVATTPSPTAKAFADVYDDWYAGITDVDVTVRAIVDLAGTGGRVLELGTGTGRLAVPLAGGRACVTGIDTSPAMLDRLAARDPDRLVSVVVGDMVDDLPPGPFDLAFVAYNTIFNLLTEARQRACFTARGGVGSGRAGAFVVEAFVPDQEVIGGPTVTVRSMAVDHVVLSVSEHRAETQTASGQFVEITEAGGVRLRPWSIRWATPEQLDDDGRRRRLPVESRWGDMSGAPFTDDSAHHVTVYRLPP